MPTTALEDWRYSRIDALDLDRFGPAGPEPAGRSSMSAVVGDLIGAIGAAATVVTVRAGEVSIAGSGRGATVTNLASQAGAGAGRPEAVPGTLGGEPDAFVTLNAALAPAPLVVELSGDGDPVVIVHWIDGEDIAAFPRTLVRLPPGGDGTVLEVVASGDGAALVVPLTELDVGAAARLGYLGVQLLGPRAWQLGVQASQVGRDATLTAAAVSLGGDYARLRTSSALVAEGGTGRLLAVYFGAEQQMHDFRTVQDHRAARTTSDLLYKGAVANQSRSVYTGLIRVEKGARGTNAYQTNRNLVLHEGAHADSVPNLEIEDNDVRCSHASAVGPIAEDQRFYLESRGVPPDVADRLITLGFLDEVLAAAPAPAVAPRLRLELVAKLARAEAVQAAGDTVGAGR
ncbi:MAG: SufB/SufD family protein [Acidimicrobiales bacterium]